MSDETSGVPMEAPREETLSKKPGFVCLLASRGYRSALPKIAKIGRDIPGDESYAEPSSSPIWKVPCPPSFGVHTKHFDGAAEPIDKVTDSLPGSPGVFVSCGTLVALFQRVLSVTVGYSPQGAVLAPRRRPAVSATK